MAGWPPTGPTAVPDYPSPHPPGQLTCGVYICSSLLASNFKHDFSESQRGMSFGCKPDPSGAYIAQVHGSTASGVTSAMLTTLLLLGVSGSRLTPPLILTGRATYAFYPSSSC